MKIQIPRSLRNRDSNSTLAYDESKLNVVYYNGDCLPVQMFDDKSITVEMLQDMSTTSYSRDALTPKLTNKALTTSARQALSQCTRPADSTTYEDTLLHVILPELIARIEELENN